MSEIPSDLRYAESHEWAREQEDGTVQVGITDHAQSQLGDLVYVDLPEVGAQVEAGSACAVVESVKAASDVYSPVSGEITEVNDQLTDAPEAVNQDPYEDGWLFCVKPESGDELEKLMDADAYDDFLED